MEFFSNSGLLDNKNCSLRKIFLLRQRKTRAKRKWLNLSAILSPVVAKSYILPGLSVSMLTQSQLNLAWDVMFQIIEYKIDLRQSSLHIDAEVRATIDL